MPSAEQSLFLITAKMKGQWVIFFAVVIRTTQAEVCQDFVVFDVGAGWKYQ